MDPGYYTVACDGRDAQGRRAESGVYLYRTQISKEVRVQKMLLLK